MDSHAALAAASFMTAPCRAAKDGEGAKKARLGATRLSIASRTRMADELRTGKEA